MSMPKSVGEPAIAVPPRSPNSAFILGSARAALTSLLLSLGFHLFGSAYCSAPGLHRVSNRLACFQISLQLALGFDLSAFASEPGSGLRRLSILPLP
jgi:hypothetical protein